MMPAERTIATERIYEGRILNLRIDTVELPNGKTTRREIVEHGDAVAVVALDADDNVLLVRQYRKPIERELLEIPAGGVHPGEEPLDCARRELQEETGYLASSMEKIAMLYTSPGFSSELMHIYLATILSEAPLEADEDEIIELVRVPLWDTPALVASGEICDAKSIAGLLLALRSCPGTKREARPRGGLEPAS
ncbi:MAG: NUDIX hydrolase [Chloroflexi bacterium]|nr:NUDIX hydrolase [Chloroflexota bacterium]